MKKETPEDFEEVLLSIQQSIDQSQLRNVEQLPKLGGKIRID